MSDETGVDREAGRCAATARCGLGCGHTGDHLTATPEWTDPTDGLREQIAAALEAHQNSYEDADEPQDYNGYADAVLALLPAPHPQGGTGDAPTKTALDLQRDPDAASQLRALSGAETPCCGMCDDECDCVDAQTCLSDWRERAEKAEHHRALLAAAPAPTEHQHRFSFGLCMEQGCAARSDAAPAPTEAGEVPDENCPDWPAPCNCDDGWTHNGHNP